MYRIRYSPQSRSPLGVSEGPPLQDRDHCTQHNLFRGGVGCILELFFKVCLNNFEEK